MAEQSTKETAGSDAGTAVAVKEKPARKASPRKQPPKPLPPWKVLLHNDDKNSMEHVVLTIVELTPLNEQDAIQRMLEAHETGVALLLTTHKERAELYKDQFQSKGLTVTIEAAE
jgi:ATP-dependent Clp protease adaptor protein ClpS